MMRSDQLKSYLNLAKQEAALSEDPSTKVGAILISASGELIGMGHNHLTDGTPSHMWDWNKYPYVVHAELAAVLCAARDGKSTIGSTLVGTWASCASCAKHLVEAGVATLARQYQPAVPPHWANEIALGDEILLAAGVRVEEII